jgi:hypothetical protein
VKSCAVLAVQADGATITTIQGLAGAENGDSSSWHPVQRAFQQHHGLQCGYCTPGMIMATVDLLKRNPSPTEDEVRTGSRATSVAAPATRTSSRRCCRRPRAARRGTDRGLVPGRAPRARARRHRARRSVRHDRAARRGPGAQQIAEHPESMSSRTPAASSAAGGAARRTRSSSPARPPGPTTSPCRAAAHDRAAQPHGPRADPVGRRVGRARDAGRHRRLQRRRPRRRHGRDDAVRLAGHPDMVSPVHTPLGHRRGPLRR